MKPMNNETMNGDNNTSGAAAHLAHYAGENEVNDDMVAKVTNVIQAHQCLAKAGAVKNADLDDTQRVAHSILVDVTGKAANCLAKTLVAEFDPTTWDSYAFVDEVEWTVEDDDEDDDDPKDEANDEPTSGGDLDQVLGMITNLAIAITEQGARLDKMTAEPTVPDLMGGSTTTDDDDEDVVHTTEGGMTVRPKAGWKPKTHKDGTNFTVGVVVDSVDPVNGDPAEGGFGCRQVFAMTADEATTKATEIVRRRLIQALDGEPRGTLGKKTQVKATWAKIAADHGITDAVCEEFMTKPNKYAQQARRTADTLRGKLGINSAEDMDRVGKAAIGDGGTASEPAPSQEQATVDMDKVKSIMDTFGVSLDEAISAAERLL